MGFSCACVSVRVRERALPVTYLCVICDVQSDVLAVADVAVLDGRTRPLAADAHG